uniref:Putative terminase n=1 Tax=viral metagenome TaxID=1070528 RepID=A0A6M3K171_9ZZZZ
MTKNLNNISEDEWIRLYYDWYGVFARDKQKPPIGDWFIWFLLSGRGFGKTRTGAEWIRYRVENESARHIALVAPTAADGRDVMVEGESGILAISPHWNYPNYEPSKRRLTWPNGAIAILYSAEEPARLNGPQHDTAWSDELGIWKYGRETWDMLQFGLRLGNPKQIVTTTPKVRNLSLIKEIRDAKKTIFITGTTFENKKNLSEEFFAHTVERYKGTRLGRQELNAELLEEVPGALWTRKLIENSRISKEQMPKLKRIVVGVDPQGKKEERKDLELEDNPKQTGIIVAGLGIDNQGYMLEDYTINGTPKLWGNEVIKAYDIWEANRVVGEVNYGGQMVEYVIKSIDPTISYKDVRASRGKYIRAEPISSFSEQSKIHHVGVFPELEDEMCSYTPESTFSPNRLDAYVWAFTELMIHPVSQWSKTVTSTERESTPIPF